MASDNCQYCGYQLVAQTCDNHCERFKQENAMCDGPIVCALCLKLMPDFDWTAPCPHWEIAEAERELLRSVEDDLAEANEDRYRLTEERNEAQRAAIDLYHGRTAYASDHPWIVEDYQ